MKFPSGVRKLSELSLLVFAILIIIFSLTRIGLMAYVGPEVVAFSSWPNILLKGLWFDIAVGSVFITPVLLYEAVLPNRWRKSKIHRVLRFSWLWFSIALLLFGVIAEATFWLEFSTRFNFIALDYLIYTHEVISNIRESYSVNKILITIGVVAASLVILIRKKIIKADNQSLSKKQRFTFAITAALLPTILLLLANVEQMEMPENAYATELAGNGLFTLAAAMRRNELDYDKFYLTISQASANKILTTLGVERKPLFDALFVKEDDDSADDVIPFIARPKNIILISVESLSASFVGAYGSTKGLTPNIDELARHGMLFEKVFATGTRTVRGLEALSLGTPPIPGQAIVRRPNNEHLATVGQLLKHQGFLTYFFYGGYGYFDNMNAYFSGNDYRIIDRTDFSNESIMFENAWGVADEALFNNAITTLNSHSNNQKPFFAHIMTTSNHRPFTYPDGRINIKSPGGRDGGVKYTDYAIGKFIKDAQKQSWFKDTLFVIVADHCASVAGKSKLPVDNYHIPLIFYAPQLLKPATYSTIVSQIDIAPTLIEVLGMRGDNHFFGHSFFDKGPPIDRAFISNYQELGYLKNDILTVLSPKRKVESYRIDPITYESTPTKVDPELLDETIAFYQTAARAFKAGKLAAPYYAKQ